MENLKFKQFFLLCLEWFFPCRARDARPAPLARAAGGKRERERDTRALRARLPPWQGPPEAKREREREMLL